MSLSRLRLVPFALALAAVAVTAVGCSATPTAPAPTGTSTSDPSTAPTAPGEHDSGDVGAAWLAGGASIGIVTWGSSSKDCQPHKAEAKADGQTIEVTLTDRAGENAACTADFGPRAIAFSVPGGVDVTKDVEVRIIYRDLKEDADLDALDAVPSDAPIGQSSAGWFDDDGILLMTYGSSTCPPVPELVVQTQDQISVSFASLDRVCTMDLSPRVTVIQLTEERQGEGPFTLRMQGDGLSGEVAVLG